MSNIKINDVPQRIQYLATGGQTQFTVPFPFFQNNFVYVWLNGVQLFQGGAPGQYTVSGAGSPSGGLVTFNTPTILNDIVTIEGIMPIDRTSIYSATISNLTGSDLNGDFNREVVMLQQLHTTQAYLQLQYAPWALVSQDLSVTKDRYIPILEAQQVWRMNDEGTLIEPYTIDTTPPSTSAPFIIYEDDPTLEQAQNLGLLASGILKQTVVAGVATLARAIPNVDYLDASTPLGTMAFQNSNNVNITGGVVNMTAGQVVNSPVNSVDIVNKAYADSIAAGFTFKAAAAAASTTNLNCTYNNGSSGVGATLTENVNGALSLDGYSPTVGQRVVIKDQSAPAQNGIYTVTDAGSAGTPFILTRATDFDSAVEIVPGAIVFVQFGTLYAETSFVQTDPVLVVGTDPILFVQFSQEYPLSMGSGGTGSSITPIANAVFSTNGSSVGQLSTTLPSGLTIPGYAHSGANSDITSLTGLTGVIQAPTFINDSLGAHVLGFGSAGGSPVNYINFTNAISTAYPIIAAAGTDTNIALVHAAKGNGLNLFYGGAGATLAAAFLSGTSYQHQTFFNFPNTSASRTVSFQDSDGTVAWLADRGMVLLGSATASASATVDFTNISAAYTNYMLVFNDVSPGTNGAQMQVFCSINNGSSYITANYAATAWALLGTTTAAGTNLAQASIIATNAQSNVTTGAGGFILFPSMSATTRAYKGYWFNTEAVNGTPVMCTLSGGGYIPVTAPINALRIQMSSGVVNFGSIQLYGMK